MPPLFIIKLVSLLHCILAQAPSSPAHAPAAEVVTDCDVLIIGGNLGGVASALSAADTNATLQVCYTDITDWPGGQATAGGTSAIDFGATSMNFPSNLPKSLGWILSHGAFGEGNSNPAGCSVSTKCFLPEYFVKACLDAFAARPNLRVYLSTVVTSSVRGGSGGSTPGPSRITSVAATQRTPTPGTLGYERLQSEALPDWYSPAPSAFFTKRTLNFSLHSSAVVIEASEFGDVLVTSGVRVAQGIETPLENSTQYDQGCGQATTVVFWMSWGKTPAPRPDPTPLGGDAGLPFHYENASSLNHSFTWRRSVATSLEHLDWPNAGDTFMLNQANDVDLPPPVFLTLEDARAQAAGVGGWAGGINLTALASNEQRAYGWYWILVNSTAKFSPGATPYLLLNRSAAGTATGLAKMPYLREARRGQFGVEGFRLCKAPLAVGGENNPGCWMPPPGGVASPENTPQTTHATASRGFKWHDTVAIGQYNFDIHHMDCPLPSYLDDYYHPAAQYYLPFRALTSWDAPNLLLAGKNIAQSFYANAATRLHPEEWATGAVSGVAAALMVSLNMSSLELYANVSILQDRLKVEGVVPMEWS